MNHDTTSSAIDKLGGTAEVARLCEVSPQAVSKWRREGIPRARLLYLRAIRPGAFDPPACTETGDDHPMEVA
jgi:hypothetical protein